MGQIACMTFSNQPEILLTTVLRRFGIQAKPDIIVEHGSCDAWWYAHVNGQDIAMLTVYAGDDEPMSLDSVRLNLGHPMLAQATGIHLVYEGGAVHLHRAGLIHTFPLIRGEAFIGGQRLDLQHLTVAELRQVQQCLVQSETWTGLVRADGLTILRRGSLVCVNGTFVGPDQVLTALTGDGVTSIPHPHAA